MNRNIANLFTGLLLLGGGYGMMGATPAPKEKEAPKEIVIPKSSFDTDPKKVKDPFFPNSVRWNPPVVKPKPVVPTVTPTQPVVPVKPPDVYRSFELKGLVGVGDSRLVLITTGVRNYTMALNEVRTVVTPDGSKRLKVESFTDKGVVIKIDGEKENKELKLPTVP